MKSDDGFSLLEMLIAVSLFAMLSAAGVAVLSSYQTAQTTILSSNSFLSDLQRAHGFIKADLDNMIERPVRGEYGDFEAAFKSDRQPSETLMRFVRAGQAAALYDKSLMGSELIEYRFNEGALVRRTYSRIDRTPETDYSEVVLLTNLTTLEIEFQKDSVWSKEWHSTAKDSIAKPDLVALDFGFKDKGHIRHLFAVGRRS